MRAFIKARKTNDDKTLQESFGWEVGVEESCVTLESTVYKTFPEAREAHDKLRKEVEESQ